MAKRDLTLGASPENYIPELEKTRGELLKDASDSVSKLQRLMKRYEDQISKPRAASKPFGPYHSAHPMTECIADQKSKENPPRDPAAVCQFIRTRSQKSDFSMEGVMTEWDSMSKAEQDGWGLEKAEGKEKDVDPDILEDMAEGGKKPAVDLSIGAGSVESTTKPPLKPVAVLPGAEKAWSPESREAATESRRREADAADRRREAREAEEPASKKAVRLGFVTPTPDDVGRPE